MTELVQIHRNYVIFGLCMSAQLAAVSAAVAACDERSLQTYRGVDQFLDQARSDLPQGLPADIVRQAFLNSYDARNAPGGSSDADLRNAEYYLMGMAAIVDGEYIAAAHLSGTPLYEAFKNLGLYADSVIGREVFEPAFRSNPENAVSSGWGFDFVYAGMAAGWSIRLGPNNPQDMPGLRFEVPCHHELDDKPGNKKPSGGGGEPGAPSLGVMGPSPGEFLDSLDPSLFGEAPQGRVEVIDLGPSGGGPICVLGCPPLNRR
jgi:hypothetical protein